MKHEDEDRFVELMRAMDDLASQSLVTAHENADLKKLVCALADGDELSDEQEELLEMVKWERRAAAVREKREAKGNGGS